MSSDDLATYLRRLRSAKGASLREVAEKTTISNAYLSQLERGKAKRPSPDKIHSLADYYDVNYEDLMRAAGYIKKNDSDEESSQRKDVSSFEAALKSADLSEEEEEMVLKFIKTLRDSD
jgi:transcriptional regulator with XRE-family HTH domain